MNRSGPRDRDRGPADELEVGPLEADALARVVEKSPDLVVIHDGIEILYANRAAVEGFGAVAEGPVVGRSIWDFIPEPYRSLLQEQVARMLDSGQTAETIEIPVRLADGSDRWTEIDASPTRYGGRAAIAATLRDVTERRRAERAAHESRARHQELFEAVPIGLYRSTLDGRFLAVNPALVMMLGYPDRDSLLRIDVRSLYVDPEDRVALLEAARSQDIVRGFEARLQTPDGEVRRVRIDAQLRCDDDGQPAYLEGSIEDVTARREAEEEARLNQQRLDRAVAASGLGLWEWDIPTGSVEVDDRWFTMLGYEPGAFPLDIDRWLDMVHPDDQATAWKALQRHLAGLEDSYRVELRLRTVDGGWRWVADRGQVVARDEGDGPLRVAGTHTDIQARKEAAEALRRSEERLAGIIRAAPLGITVSRLHTGEFVEVNETFARMLGYERDELLGRSSIDMGLWVDAGDRERLRNELIAEDRTRGFPVRFRTRDGDTRTVELSTELITVDGETCALALHQDVTDSRLLEEQLRQAQKMEAVGRLAGGVAHDFNNLLTAITGHVEFLLDDLDQDDPRRTDAYEIREGADRARRLTRQLLAFSRQQVLNPRRVDLSDVVASFEGLLRRLIGEDIDLRVIRHEPCLVRVDPSQLEQVVLNLAVNARDAMPDGGALTLETGCSDLSDPGEAGFPPGLRPGQYATLHVTDSGSGMDGDTRARIFEPFFTTKPAGKGTGLGLSTVYGIISQSGGHIEVDSEPGDGTTFSIYLPLVDGEPDPIARPTPAARIASPESGTKVVLLVEDEDAVRALAKRVLERSSYRVLSAGDGNAALRMVDNHGIPDLLLTDMVMPGMGGRELAQQLHERAPDLPVIFMSGYSEDMLGSARSHANFLEKPFTPNDLTDALRSALEPEPHP